MTDKAIELVLLPSFLATEDKKHKSLVSGFIWKRYHTKGWDWCDNINKSDWTSEQINRFLVCLPFTKSTWNRASQWLEKHQGEYWASIEPDIYYQANADFDVAIEKFIEYGRSYTAINCLGWMLQTKQTIKAKLCVQALLTALSCKESSNITARYRIAELIKFLQSEPSVAQEDLFKIEWKYLPLLNCHSSANPKLLENRLGSVNIS